MNTANIYIVIGLEGCGHHGFTPIIRSLIKGYARENHQESVRLSHIFNRRCFQKLHNRDVFRDEISEFFRTKTTNDLVLDRSFPAGPAPELRPVDRQWLISDIYDEVIKYTPNLHMIHLKRDIYNTINSHPTFDGGILSHAKLLVDIDKFILNEMEKFEAKKVPVSVVNYENIDSEETVRVLSDITGVDKNIVSNRIKRHFKISNKDYRKIIDEDIMYKLKKIVNQ